MQQGILALSSPMGVVFFVSPIDLKESNVSAFHLLKNRSCVYAGIHTLDVRVHVAIWAQVLFSFSVRLMQG